MSGNSVSASCCSRSRPVVAHGGHHSALQRDCPLSGVMRTRPWGPRRPRFSSEVDPQQPFDTDNRTPQSGPTMPTFSRSVISDVVSTADLLRPRATTDNRDRRDRGCQRAASVGRCVPARVPRAPSEKRRDIRRHVEGACSGRHHAARHSRGLSGGHRERVGAAWQFRG